MGRSLGEVLEYKESGNVLRLMLWEIRFMSMEKLDVLSYRVGSGEGREF